MYVDPNLISNLTQCRVTIQSPENPSTITSEPDFIVIQPSSESCDKQLDNPDFRDIQTDVLQCIGIAHKALSDHPNTQVFISSLPPRYDTEESSNSTDLWNSILMTETFLHERVHVVPQSGLDSREVKRRFERYQQDGFLLTPYGTKLLSKNIVTSILRVTNRSNKPSMLSVKKPSIQMIRRKHNRIRNILRKY